MTESLPNECSLLLLLQGYKSPPSLHHSSAFLAWEQAKSNLFPSPALLCPASVISCGLPVSPIPPMTQGSPQQSPAAFIIPPLPLVTVCILPGTPMTTGTQLDFSPSEMGLGWERSELSSSVTSFSTLFLFSSRCSCALPLTREAEQWQAVLLSRERRAGRLSSWTGRRDPHLPKTSAATAAGRDQCAQQQCYQINSQGKEKDRWTRGIPVKKLVLKQQ